MFARPEWTARPADKKVVPKCKGREEIKHDDKEQRARKSV